MSSSEQASVGFGRASLWGSWKTDKKPADEIDVRTLAARRGGSTALVAVADFMQLWPSSCLRIRARIARELGIAEESVGIFATQNHGVDGDGMPGLDSDAIDRAFVTAAREALASLRPAAVAMVAIRPDPPLNVCRRIRFGNLGAFTFYFGYRMDDLAPGRADVSHLMKLALARMVEGKRLYPVRSFEVAGKGPEDYLVPDGPVPVPSPLYLPPPTDGLLQALFFREAGGGGGAQGKPIGALLRFPAHPNTANRGDVDWSSGDYPVYVRRRLEEAFGGRVLFMTGPCGDSSTLLGRKSLESAGQTGRQVADAALAALPAAEWQPVGPVQAFAQEVELRFRPDYPASLEAAKATCEELETNLRGKTAGRPLAEIKRLLERWELALYVSQGAVPRWTGVDACGRAGETFTHPLYVARIGPAVIAGLPGEPFGGISVRMRNETLGDRLIVSEAGNGFLSYVPTAEEYPLGGYGPSAALCDASSEERLVRAIRTAIEAKGW